MPVNTDTSKYVKTSFGSTKEIEVNDDYLLRYVVLDPGKVIPLQHHTTNHRTFYVLIGQGKYTDYLGTEYVVRAGDRIVVEPTQNFSFEASYACDLTLLETGTNRTDDSVVSV